MKKLLEHTPLFLFLLPNFFILHGYNENFGNIIPSNCLLLAISYSGAAAFLYFVFLFFFKNYFKAALMASYVFAFYCFFGAIQDFFKIHGVFFSRYLFLLSSFLIFFVVLIIALKKTGRSFFRLSLFLNTLFIIYILIDAGSIGWNLAGYVPLEATLANVEGCRVRAGGRDIQPVRRTGDLSTYQLPAHAARPLEAICRS